MNVKKIILKKIVPVLLLTSITLISIAPISCRVTAEGIELLTGNFNPPKITCMEIIDSRNLCLSFEQSIESAEAELISQDTISNSISVNISLTDENKKIVFSWLNDTTVGMNYKLIGTIFDSTGNTLTFCLPFTGYNSNIPKLILSEVRNAYSTTTSSSTGIKKIKTEFIEIVALTSGNLSGIEIVNAGEGEEKKYVFPSIDVKAGEYIVLHLRNMEEGCINELGNDLTLSTATDSSLTARDLWINNTKARLSSSDIILIQNSCNGDIQDVLVYAIKDNEEWDETYYPIIDSVTESGMWQNELGDSSCSITSAVVSDFLTSSAVTRTLSRQNVDLLIQQYSLPEFSQTKTPGNASQWIVTANSGSGKSKIAGDTPGLPNSNNAYEP